MRKRTLFIMLAALLTLGTAPMLGCNGEDDPSQNNGNNGNNGDNNGTGDAGNDADDGGNGDDGGTDDGGTDDGGDDGGTDDGGDDGGNGDCTPFADFTGQAFTGGENPDPHNGGNPVEGGSIEYDANLQTVYDAVPEANEDDDATPDVVENVAELDPAVEVTEALVIATTGDNPDTPDEIEGNGRLWLQDTNASIQFFFAFPENETPTDTAIKVGDRVSFNVTEVKNFGGTPEITAIESGSFSVVSSDNDVPFMDLTGMEVTPDYYYQLVRVAGEITADNGTCGGSSKCYDLTHGAEGSEQVTTFRVNEAFTVDVGTCLTYFGPLSGFPGPVGNTGIQPQLDAQNFDWAFTSN
jgi:hypothetical protein